VKAFVVGSGAREHALCWLLSKSTIIDKVYAAPGNAGIAGLGRCFPDINPMDSDAIAAAAGDSGADFVFIGPEAPCAAGLADGLAAKGMAVIGPPRASAQLESSKAFSKSFLFRHTIPTADARTFSSFPEFEQYIRRRNGEKLVVKQSGLAAGKGVLESDTAAELLAFGRRILTHDSLLVEEYLTGWEVSVFALSDGRDYKLLPTCMDFKKAHDGDMGPNTGGMGSVCPVPTVDHDLWRRITREIVEPTFNGMNADGLNYKGVLYFGLMITAHGPKVLEYNIRFGDPEAQVLLPMIDTDFGDICRAMLLQKLGALDIRAKAGAALGVVVAADGYPGSYAKGIPVSGLPHADEERLLVFHASTRLDSAGVVQTGGGRCFTVVGRGDTLAEAYDTAYGCAGRVNFEGAWFRSDIGKKFIQGDQTA
jgi:phosphoribosylamine--glycine ligase